MKIEKIIRKNNREQFYDYYMSLGYDRKTAASLALFTYGDTGYDSFSMDELYEALCSGRDYPPRRSADRIFGAGPAVYSAPSAPGMVSSYSMAAPSPSVMPAPGMMSVPEESEDMELEAGICDSGLLMTDSIDEGDSGVMMSAYNACEMKAAAPLQARTMSKSMSMGAGMRKAVSVPEFATDEYENIEEKDARSTVSSPTSTFRMTTNTASAGVVLNQLRNGRRINRSMVRIEEMLNYFRYDSKIPEKEMFRISTEVMDADKNRKYLYINVQGREEVREKQNIVILLDVSGSMSSQPDITQAVIATIVSKLGKGDTISLVTYSTDDRVVLDGFKVKGPEDRIRILESLLAIEISGCTWGSKGIDSAYRIGKENYIEGGNNQVILITDGDLNFGITDKGGLEELIEAKKKDNIFLSVIGSGLTNYKDDKLEALCKHGNGVYRTVNNLTDVRKSIDEEYSSLVNIIAKDVKGQVEFNPDVVESHRLLGFENRTIAHEDFANDKVISEPFGSGGYGVALYELTMKTDAAPAFSGLKYSRLVTTGSKELCTIKVRYKEPLEDVSHELVKVVKSPKASYTDNLLLAYIVYVCAEKLRGSDKISKKEIAMAKKYYKKLGKGAVERNAADLYKLYGILDKSERELNIGAVEDPFLW